MSIELIYTERIKTLILLGFEGVCGYGSDGNSDSDYIIDTVKKEIIFNKNIQGAIFNFSKCRYEFGNRFAEIFDANSYKNNKQFYIRIIPNNNDINSWESLIKHSIAEPNCEFIQTTVSKAVISIRNQMNNND
jgi:hypothetical protein